MQFEIILTHNLFTLHKYDKVVIIETKLYLVATNCKIKNEAKKYQMKSKFEEKATRKKVEE